MPFVYGIFLVNLNEDASSIINLLSEADSLLLTIDFLYIPRKSASPASHIKPISSSGIMLLMVSEGFFIL